MRIYFDKDKKNVNRKLLRIRKIIIHHSGLFNKSLCTLKLSQIISLIYIWKALSNYATIINLTKKKQIKTVKLEETDYCLKKHTFVM